MHRSAEELRIRCKLILDKPDLMLLVDRGSSPTSIFDMVMERTNGDIELAKAARWLAILRRDYLQNYEEFVSGLTTPRQDGTARERTLLR